MAAKKDKVLSERLQNNIKFLRNTNGKSLTEMAEILGCRRDDIANWETRSTPKLPDLVGISDYFKVNIDDLIRKDISKKVAGIIQNKPARDDWQSKYIDLLEKYSKLLETQK